MASLITRAALVRIVLASSATIMLAACSDGPMATGPMRTEAREVDQFDAIDVDGATRLRITVGVPASVEIEGRDPFLSRLETEVHGDTLRIKTKRKDWIALGTTPRPTIHIGVPSLDKLEIEGGNDVRISGFAGGKTKIRLAGATNLVANGKLDEVDVFMAGAGVADLGDLVAGTADVTVAGVGSVFVHPTHSLDATMNGVGAIFYTGTPGNVKTRMNGVGAIGQRSPDEMRRERGRKAEPVDPDTLQPEYEREPAVEKEPATDMTEVI